MHNNKIHFVYGSRPSLTDCSEFKVFKEIDFKPKICKNGDDLCDLEFDLVTLRSYGYVDHANTYPWIIYRYR